MRNIIIVGGLAAVLVALIIIYLLIPGDDPIAEFCAQASDLEDAIETGNNIEESIRTFLDAVDDDMISGFPDVWQGPANDLVSVSEGAVGLSGFQLSPVIDRIAHELEEVTDQCEQIRDKL